MASLIGSVSTLRHHAAELRSHWLRLTDLVRSAWSRLLHDDLVRNFYLAIYNDATDQNGADAAAASRSTDPVASKRLDLGPPSSTVTGGAHGGGSTNSEDSLRGERTWYSFLSTAAVNADISVIDAGGKMVEVSEELSGNAESTDVDVALAGCDRELELAYETLRRNLDLFRLDHCDPSAAEWVNNVRLVIKLHLYDCPWRIYRQSWE